jgi:uncharacterized Ntn-hydrolase superfamily protein
MGPVRRAFAALAALALAFALATGAAPASASREAGTFSIVAFDTATGEIGVAVESRAFAVGTRVPWARAGVGGIATQASTRAAFGPRGLAMLAAGIQPRDVIDSLTADDEGREDRQIGVVSAFGRAATFTGSRCSSWAGGIAGPGFAIQGNILAGPQVVREMERAYRETKGELAERLLAALAAGQQAGGDRRGQQSAALLVVRPSEQYPEYRERYVQLKVEDHARPIDELTRLYRVYEATGLAEAHARYAETYERAGRVADATRERSRVGQTLKRVLADPNSSASSLNAMAWTACSMGAFLDDALRAATRAAVLDPRNTDILDTIAECHLRRGEYVAALEAIGDALDLDPKDAQLKARKKQIEDAANAAKRAPAPAAH